MTAKPATKAQDPAPMSLTASDGSGLVLARLDGKAVVEGPLAFTELHLYFHNPEQRAREGTFEITLPAGAAVSPGAAVSRFAMEINGKMMEPRSSRNSAHAARTRTSSIPIAARSPSAPIT